MEKEKISLFDFHLELFKVIQLSREVNDKQSADYVHATLKSLIESLTEEQVKQINSLIFKRATDVLFNLENKCSAEYIQSISQNELTM